jgi:aldose sugar dehydrogenase
MTAPLVRPALVAAATALLAAVAVPDVAAQQVVEEEIRSEYQTFRLVQVADGLEHPWAIAFLGQDRMLVTERPGRLQLIEGGRATEVTGLPEVHVQNQGGLLDVVAHPRFEENGWIYLTYSKARGEETVPALARARLDGARLVDLEELFESNTYTSPGRHYGSRILFLGDGTLMMTIGDRGATPERAQDPADHSGSVVRLNEDGTVPADNPFVGDPARADEIFSYGHRNIQGIIRHPATGAVWATEHGATGQRPAPEGRGGRELRLASGHARAGTTGRRSPLGTGATTATCARRSSSSSPPWRRQGWPWWTGAVGTSAGRATCSPAACARSGCSAW